MVRFVSVGIDVVSTAVVLVPVMFILYDTCLKQCSPGKRLKLLCFAFYLSAVCSVTGVPSMNHLVIDLRFNLIPLIDIVNGPMGYVKNTVLNIVMFVPFGFFLPVIWERRYSSLRKVFWTGLGVSAGIEVLQIFTHRLTDVDDLVTNTVGAVLGYYLAKLYVNRRQKKDLEGRKAVSEENFFRNNELCLIILVVLLIMFLLQPLIAGNIWESVLESEWWEAMK